MNDGHVERACHRNPNRPDFDTRNAEFIVFAVSLKTFMNHIITLQLLIHVSADAFLATRAILIRGHTTASPGHQQMPDLLEIVGPALLLRPKLRIVRLSVHLKLELVRVNDLLAAVLALGALVKDRHSYKNHIR